MANMDVSTLADALQKLATDDGSEGSFTQLVLKGLQSDDPAVQQSTVSTLYTLLVDGHSDSLAAQRASRLTTQELVFADHALDYIPTLFAAPPVAQPEASELILLCAQHCSPREAMLALGEACSGIEERFFGYIVSDDEELDAEENMDNQGAGSEDVQKVVPGQMRTLFLALATSFSRMPSIKSTPTLLTISDVLESALIHMGSTCAGAGDDSIAQAALGMIEQAWAWVQRSTDVGGEQRAILSQLFYLSISLFGPLAHDSLKRWFAAKYPKYAAIRTQPMDAANPHDGDAAHPLTDALQTACLLKLDTQTLIDNIAGASVGSRVSPHASFASLILVAHQLAINASNDTSSHDIQLPPLIDTLTLLSAALGSTAIDAGLTYLFELVLRLPMHGLAADEAEQLIETLFPIAATHPDPLIRMAVWKLVCEMLHKVSDVEGKVRLLRQLLEPANPFIHIRLQALVLLRQELADAARQPPSAETLLSPQVWDLPLTATADDIDPDDLFGPYTAFLTEMLVLRRFIFDLDQHNSTGIRNVDIRRGDIESLEQARRLLAIIKRAQAGNRDAEGQVGREESLHGLGQTFVAERLEEAIVALDSVMRI